MTTDALCVERCGRFGSEMGAGSPGYAYSGGGHRRQGSALSDKLTPFRQLDGGSVSRRPSAQADQEGEQRLRRGIHI